MNNPYSHHQTHLTLKLTRALCLSYLLTAPFQPARAENIIANGGFSGITPWTTSLTNGATASLDTSTGWCKVDIVNGTTSKANVHLRQNFFADLVQGSQYTINFTARADASKAIDVILYSSTNTILWAQYNASVTTTSQTFSYSWTSSGNYTGTYLSFRLGGNNTDIYFDNVSVHQSGKLTWAPPTLTNPTTLQLTAANTVPVLSPGVDYIIRMPASARTKRVSIQGGRNVVIIGGFVQISTSDHAFYILEGDAGRTVHIEGCLVTHSGTGQGDAVDVNAPTTIVQVENLRIEHLQGAGDQLHADIIQPWGGSKELRVDRLSGTTNYQAFFLIANYNSNHRFTFKNINVQIEPEWYAGASGGDFVWLDRGLSGAMGGPVPTAFINVFAKPRAGETLDIAVSPSSKASDVTLRCSLVNNYLTWPNLSYVTGGIYQGVPVNGDFVPSGTAGLNYVSPGYQ